MLAVANYHYIRQDFSAKYPSIFGLTPRQFREQLENLSKEGDFISQEQLLSFRESELDKNYFLITFDDGLKEQFELARPILHEMGIPYIFFINTANFKEREVSLVHKVHLLRAEISSEELLGNIRKKIAVDLSPEEELKGEKHYNYDERGTAHLKYLLNFKLNFKEQEDLIQPLFSQYFDEDQIAKELYMEDEMLARVHEEGCLASHAHRHLPLGLVDSKTLATDLKETQAFFELRFGEKAKLLSYPYGSFEACSGISAEVAKSGFEMAFTMERAVNKEVNLGPFLLSRYDANDLPGGKSDLFKTKPIFETPHLRKWHQYETGIIYKR